MATLEPVNGITTPPADQEEKDYGYYTKLTISEYKRNARTADGGNAFKLASTEPKLVLLLPIPGELRDDTSVGYTNVNLETVGDFMNGRGLGPMINSMALRSTGNVIESGLGSLSNKLSDLGSITGGIAAGFVNIAKAMFPAEQINSALQQSYGAAPNPNPSVQFQGPVLRDFALSWIFYPKNEQESRTINDMIKRLKGFALPSNNQGNNGAVLNYPHVCQLNFYPWDGSGASIPGDNGWTDNSIIRIKKCFMAGVNVNYHAYGTPAFFEGTKLPVTYQLTINFKEIEYLLATDWYAAGQSGNESVTAAGILGDFAESLYNSATEAGSELWNALPGFLKVAETDEAETDPPPEQNSDDEARTVQTNTAAATNAINSLEAGTFLGYTVPVLPSDGAGPVAAGTTFTYLITKGSNGTYVVGRTISTGAGIPFTPVTFNTADEAVAYLNTARAFNSNATSRVVPPPGQGGI